MATILVVDDSFEQRETLAMLLRHNGHQAHCAASGPEALELIARTPPDLVLLDLVMAGMDGVMFLRQLRIQGNRVPVMLVTDDAGDTEPARIRAMEYNIVGCFTRGFFSNDALLSSIRKYFDLTRGRPPPQAAGG